MSTPAHEPQHFAYLDAVRGMAFLGVLSVHCAIYCGDFPGSNIAQQGGYGVQLFFLASAITLCYSMASRKEANWIGLVHFYVRRIFRIVPLFWVAILVYRGVPSVVTQMWMSGWAPHGLHASYFVLTALFLHGWNPNTFNSIVPGGWSIAVEMTFCDLSTVLFLYY